MSYNKWRNTILGLTGMQTSNVGFATTGIVVAINPDNSSLVKVRISEEFNENPALQTGWIPVASPWTGNQFGFFAPPQYNDLIFLIFAQGDSQNPIAGLRVFNDVDVALNVPPGECWLVHQTGSFLKFTNDGKILINGEVEIDISSPVIKISASTDCEIKSPLVKIGDTSSTLYKLVTDTFLTFFNNHLHTTPSGNSGPPTIPADSTNATVHTEAN